MNQEPKGTNLLKWHQKRDCLTKIITYSNW